MSDQELEAPQSNASLAAKVAEAEELLTIIRAILDASRASLGSARSGVLADRIRSDAASHAREAVAWLIGGAIAVVSLVAVFASTVGHPEDSELQSIVPYISTRLVLVAIGLLVVQFCANSYLACRRREHSAHSLANYLDGAFDLVSAASSGESRDKILIDIALRLGLGIGAAGSDDQEVPTQKSRLESLGAIADLLRARQ